ncbi:MAG: hypothetical protein RL657_2745 [Pseudomonadota bacterium]
MAGFESPPSGGMGRRSSVLARGWTHAWRFCLCWMLLVLGGTGGAVAQESLHQGPVLDIRIQRGDSVLPVFKVNRLQSGDQILLRASAVNGLRQILMVALLQSNGQQTGSHSFEIDKEPIEVKVPVTANDQIPVIVLAPLLRNLFGLYSSFLESERLLQEVIRSDPQRFVALQTNDVINRAIATITQWLDAQVRGRSGEEAAGLARALAEKFGVRNISPECFKGGIIQTQCVAIDMVTSKDFFMPSSGVLAEVSGKGGTQDLSSFLVSNLRVISQASDYLSNRFRDQYEFAPSFARPLDDSGRIQLLSPVRNRLGSTKTAYIYVPGWFSGTMPRLMADDGYAGCFTAGRARVTLEGRLPLAPYWHSFSLTVSDPGSGAVLGRVDRVGFNPSRDELVFDPAGISASAWPRSNQVLVQLSGWFGFEPMPGAAFLMDLPARDVNLADIHGAQALMSGGVADLLIQSPARSACLLSASLTLPDGTQLQPLAQQPERFQVDLSDVPSGMARLSLVQVGKGEIGLNLPIHPSRATFALASGPNPLLVHPSAHALQWALGLGDDLISDDSAFSLRLRALPSLVLSNQAHSLQWRVTSETGRRPNPTRSASLMLDLRQQEVRTRTPVGLSGLTWPGMVNPLEFRVVGEQGLPLAPWQPLGKAMVTLPVLKKWNCPVGSESWTVSGERLELIRNAGWVDLSATEQAGLPEARFAPCPDGLCLVLEPAPDNRQLALQMHWLGDRRFVLTRPAPAVCP